MPNYDIQDVIFDVNTTNLTTLHADWKKAKARYEPEWRARGVDFNKGLGPALDKWAASFKIFNKSRFALARKRALWTNIQPIAQAKIKTEARALLTDAKAAAKAARNYLNKIEFSFFFSSFQVDYAQYISP